LDGRSQLGRSARKRLNRRLSEAMQVYSAAGEPKQKETLTEQAKRGEVTAAAKELYLSKYRLDLDKSAKLLSAEGCWAYYDRHRLEAARFGVAAELRALAAAAAARFLGPPVKTVYKRPL